jgi:hypothetical protein
MPTATHSIPEIWPPIRLALDNLEAVLAEGGMTLASVVRLNIY